MKKFDELYNSSYNVVMKKFLLILCVLSVLLISCGEKKSDSPQILLSDFGFSFLFDGRRTEPCREGFDVFSMAEKNLSENKYVRQGDEIYNAVFSYEKKDEFSMDFTIKIFDGEKLIQTISEERFISACYRPFFYDCNFDGYDDLIYYYSGGSGGNSYKCYLWDKDYNIFQEMDKELLTPSFDESRKLVYEYWRSGNEYEMWVSNFRDSKKDELIYVDVEGYDYAQKMLVRFEGEQSTEQQFIMPGNFEKLSPEEKRQLKFQFDEMQIEINKTLGLD